jgi:hypothetical protein
MHEDELAMPEPSDQPPRSRGRRITKVLAGCAAVATLGIVGATVASASADPAGTSGTTRNQISQTSVDLVGTDQGTAAGEDCPFKSRSEPSAIGTRD